VSWVLFWAAFFAGVIVGAASAALFVVMTLEK
jgi:hypothetical protein